MRGLILIALLFFSYSSFSQWKDYSINTSGDTLNRVDLNGKKQGIWVHRYEKLRGEPGYEEEGFYKDDRKEGEWKLYTLMGDLAGIENFSWGLKNGVCRYFMLHGGLRLEQNWVAINPDKQYDTLMVEDLNKLDSYRQVIVKNEGAALKHGTWNYYDPQSGGLIRSENYEFGRLLVDEAELVTKPQTKKEVAKPQEVLDFEKKNEGKKKVKFKDGSTGGF